MQGYKTKYLCSGISILFRKLLTEYKDQKQVIPTTKNLIISKKEVNDKIKADKFNGNKQYPNKQKI